MNKQQLATIAEWDSAKQQLELFKARETELRAKVIADCFSAENTEGTETLDLDAGWKLKVTKKLSYKLSKQADVEKALDKLPQLIADRLVTWKPSLSTKEYKLLDAKGKKIIDAVLTIDPTSPSLELVAPKEK